MKHAFKYLAACALAAAALSANARIIGVIPNNAGGKIMFTDDKTGCIRGHVVMSNSSAGAAQMGCWTTEAGQIFVLWEHGSRNIYPLDAVLDPTPEVSRPVRKGVEL